MKTTIKNVLVSPQPNPIQNSGKAVSGLVLKDMRHRVIFGHEKYQSFLCVNNGRNHLIDAYQEVLDLAFYLRSEIEENYIEPTELW